MARDMHHGKGKELPILAIDLGGSKIITAIISSKGGLIAREYQSTEASQGARTVIERLFSGIDRLLIQNSYAVSHLGGISLATAGVIDIEQGLVTASPNLPGWRNVPLRGIVAEKYEVPVFLINDADAAALGEHRLGAGRGLKTLVLLTLGTGIGGGIIIDERLYLGVSGSAAEIGHTVVDADGPACKCGRNGCLETLASGTAVARDAQMRIDRGERSSLLTMTGGRITDVTAEMVYTAAKDGDEMSLAVIARAAYYLGIGVVNLVNIFNPQAVILGGSMAGMSRLLFDPVRQMVKEQAFPLFAQVVEILPAQLGNDAGVFGAAFYALDQESALR